jgi:hypothetical protein
MFHDCQDAVTIDTWSGPAAQAARGAVVDRVSAITRPIRRPLFPSGGGAGSFYARLLSVMAVAGAVAPGRAPGP